MGCQIMNNPSHTITHICIYAYVYLSLSLSLSGSLSIVSSQQSIEYIQNPNLANQGPLWSTAQLTYSTGSAPERLAPVEASAALDAAVAPTAAPAAASMLTPARRARSTPFQRRSPGGCVGKSWCLRHLETGDSP